jgi:hypothetical protein
LNFTNYLFCYGDSIWDSAVKAFTNDHRLGSLTDIVVIFRDGDTVNRRAITYSNALGRPWGLNPRCGNAECNSLPGNLRFQMAKKDRGDGNHSSLVCFCVQCGWRTKRIMRPNWVVPTKREFYFWHEYPLSSARATYITTQMQN